MRNPRAEAAARLGDEAAGRPGGEVLSEAGVRVLEPSPPAVELPPRYAEDPLEGGTVLPVERAGARTWLDVCNERDDVELLAWCGERWLVPRPLEPLPAGFAATRATLHTVAEHLLAPIRHQANGMIGLRFAFRGFGTPVFRDPSSQLDRQVRVEDGTLVDGVTGVGDRRHALVTLRDAGAFLGIEPGAPAGVYTPSTSIELDEPLVVSAEAARALGDWYGFTTRLLEQLRADAAPEEAPGVVQLWPEHFDVAVDLGAPGRRANCGGSPGDGGHPEPYLYVGPWDRGRTVGAAFWNEPFGASLGYREILAGADPLAFLREGMDRMRRA